MKKRKIIETPLPEEVIHIIQSFMSGKEAARSAILSKSWYNAWLTRPTIDFENHFSSKNHDSLCKPSDKPREVFEEFAKKTMERYQHSRLKIESFRLITYFIHHDHRFVRNLIAGAMEAGAVDLQLELSVWPCALPPEVLVSETLLRLSASGCIIDGNCVISCSRLKSLNLKHATIRNRFKDIMISCCDSLEELSLSWCWCDDFILNRENLYELRNVRRLSLYGMKIDSMFFTDFASRFPCLKDLKVHQCHGFTSMDIATNSLQTISFYPNYGESWRAKFYVPNIQKFTLSSYGLGSKLSIDGASKEWEFNLTMNCTDLYNICWLPKLKTMLKKFRLSRISLFLKLGEGSNFELEHEVGIDPIVVERLMIYPHSSISYCLLVIRLFRIFRPKFITHEWHTDDPWVRNESINVLCKKLLKKLITPNCGIPDQDMFGQFGLKKVNMEVYEMLGDNKYWRPLVLEKPLDVTVTPKSKRKIRIPKNKRKVRFELLWD